MFACGLLRVTGGRLPTLRRAESCAHGCALQVGEENNDITVVGTNGRGGVSKLFFGSTTESLLRRCTGAVMLMGDTI